VERAAIRNWLSPSANLALLEADLDRAVAQLHHKAAAFEVQLADSVHPTRLAKTDAFRFFRRLLNYTPHVAAGASLQHDTYLDYFVADSSVDCHRGHLELDAVRVKVLSLKEPPSATFPQVLEDLYTLPGEFIACLEWCRILGIIVVTGRPEPGGRPTTAPTSQPTAPSPDRLRDYQDRLRVLD